MEETIGRRLRRYVRDGIKPNDIELTMAADAELWKEMRIAELEAALARVADEPNIDKARAIADAVLSSKR